jgi:hypothetical protein
MHILARSSETSAISTRITEERCLHNLLIHYLWLARLTLPHAQVAGFNQRQIFWSVA